MCLYIVTCTVFTLNVSKLQKRETSLHVITNNVVSTKLMSYNVYFHLTLVMETSESNLVGFDSMLFYILFL